MGDYRDAEENCSCDVGMASSSLDLKSKPRVLVTGFGPFGEHTINASWEAAQELKLFTDLTDAVDLIVERIPVVYSDVSSTVPSLWEKYSPDLVIHCGVSAFIAWKNIIQVERKAHSFGYQRPDVCAAVPVNGWCREDHGEQCLRTLIDLETLVAGEEGRCEDSVLSCQISDDAGRYLCEFIYYTSLTIDPTRTLFIHVPPLYKPFSPREIGRAVKNVILKVVGKNTAVDANGNVAVATAAVAARN
ncbi:pyroglutamyl-peptidase 1-like [Paramacrobiotus metropolitanus]|uniref:pyroglutamyl-peptidase 1-like n=1 Tax=Paramacrobiotus metropolitanus TaxID=2943436 RepID=UPI00244635CE|nr:pyroglutamyl-peptidase 1-like [Paramacrobiotus metropolitanus]XP_055347044.1 pyroglutamyl-peptidase 1-like [Paramacrobiotus metropolitanus]